METRGRKSGVRGCEDWLNGDEFTELGTELAVLGRVHERPALPGFLQDVWEKAMH